MNIADFLSEEKRRTLILSSIECGDVFRLRLTEEEGITPKHDNEDSRNKFFVVIGKTNDGSILGFLVINSIPSRYGADLHLSAAKYSFLTHDSYICCSDIKEIKIETFISRHIEKSNKERSYGKISSEDLEKATNVLISSRYSRVKTLRKFGLIE